MSSSRVLAIVDPYSTGALMADEIKKRGHHCLMVQSGKDVPRMYRSSFHGEDFATIIRHSGDVEETGRRLQAHNVDFVIAGCEMGVELSDVLSERLGLASNGTRLSQARRNKQFMGQALRECGVRTPHEFSSSNLNDIQDWVRQHGSRPVVVKPLCSSGSDGVRLCHTETEIQSAVEDVIGHTDVFGLANHAVLVQEFLTGTQYAVDTVSCEGRHKVAAFWQYGKPADSSIFFGNEYLELLPYSQSLNRQLFPFVVSVLEAMEIRYGPAHCEVMLTHDGPVIIEIGARLNGGKNPLLSKYCGGKSQIDMTLDAYLDPLHFLENLDETYELSAGAMRVFLIPPEKGRLNAPPDVDLFKRLASLQDIYMSAKVGRPLSRIVGWVLLVHEDRAVLHRDLQQLRRLESSGLYQVSPDI